MNGVQLSPAAVEYLQPLLASIPSAIGIRVGVKKAGCSGYEYTLEYAQETRPFEETFAQDGVTIFIDKEVLAKFLHGTVIDFTTDGLNQGLQFNNPNVEAKCGCGESFALKGVHASDA